MAVEYQVLVRCKARAPSGTVVTINPGTYSAVGEEPVRLIHQSGEIEITQAEFQRLKTAGALKPRQTPR